MGEATAASHATQTSVAGSRLARSLSSGAHPHDPSAWPGRRWRLLHFVTVDGALPPWNVRPSADRLRLLTREIALSKSASRARLAEIIRKRSFGRGEITLASGRTSNFYFNLKPTMLDPEGAALLAELTYEALKDDGLDYVGGLEMGAVPLAGAVAQLSWIKGHPIAAFFVRKKPKEHGAKLAVEGLAKGESLQGKRVVIVEDVTTTGESALKAVEAARDAGGVVALVLTMVDREEGASETFAQAGLAFRSLYKASEFLKD
jgi:orotate phosphoribosyltransferase